MSAACDAGANVFIETYFHDCVYGPRDMVGFLLGMSSISLWMVAQIPQLVANFRTKQAEALSAWFLAQWLLGDTFNLVGCLLKGDQLPTVVFTAQYFICMDVVLLVQYVYYRSLRRRRERVFVHRAERRHHWREENRGGGPERTQGCPDDAPTSPTARHALVGSASAGRVLAGSAALAAAAGLTVLVYAGSGTGPGTLAAGVPRRLLVSGGPSSIGPWQRVVSFLGHPDSAYYVGIVLGYASSVLYLLSRVSQIYKNAVRRSAEGLALSMFFVAAAANTTYGGSILVRSYSWGEVIASLPWLVGSLGTVALDVGILIQARSYNDHDRARARRSDGHRKPEPHPIEQPLIAEQA